MTTFLRKYPWVPPLIVGVFWIVAVIDARNQLRALAATVVDLATRPPAEVAELPVRPTPACLGRDDLEIHLRQVADHAYEIDRTTLEALLGDMSRLSRSARIVPEIRDGRASGFRLYSVRPNGPLDRLGFRSGDLIMSANALDISSPEKALEAYARLKAADAFVVALERNGDSLTNSYRIR